jgi:hypothetical protein
MRRAARPVVSSIKWQHLLLGFEGDGTLSTAEREDHIRSARRAIEEIFDPRALERWVGPRWKTAALPEPAVIIKAVAMMVTAELNRARRPAAVGTFEFRVRSEERIGYQGPANQPDIKPKDYVCLYMGEIWVDSARLPIELKHTPQPGARGQWRSWKPDARHEMVAELYFDCVFQPTRARRRNRVR